MDGPSSRDQTLVVEPTAVASRDDLATLPFGASAAAVDEALPGDLAFAQRYELGDELARGGLARIRDAYDRVLQRRVAVKQLLSRQGDADVRFLREARITGRLAHPNIVPIYDLGLDADGAPFYAMKWVEGRSLHDLIEDRATLDDRLGLLPHVIAIADALAYAHAAGVIHRDLKPGNVLVGDFGETIVIDWGLALALDAAADPAVTSASTPPTSAPRLTSAGSVIGTPAYMPPEQARGEPVDTRADIYALGATLYHVIGGLFPYADAGSSIDGDEPAWVRVLDQPPLPLAAVCPAAPPELCAIVERAMARDPAARFATAAALGAALAGFVEHHQSHRLASAAERRAAELAEVVRAVRTDDPAAVAAVYRQADVVRFGFEQALAAWPDNPLARAGQLRFSARMFEFECAVGNLAAAAALAAALPPDPARAHALAALGDAQARRASEAAAFAHARDRTIGGRERLIMLGTVGAMLAYFLIEAVVSHRSLDDPGALRRILRNSIVVAVPTLAMMWIWRRRMFANEFSVRAGRTVVAMLLATVLHRVLAIVIEQSARQVFTLDMLLILVAMVTFGGRLGVTLGIIAGLGAGLCAWAPDAALLIYNGSIVAIATILAVAWSRATRAGADPRR